MERLSRIVWVILGISGSPSLVAAQPAGKPMRSAAVDVAVGQGHSCACLTDGSVYCWGSNHSGELGIGGRSVQVLGTPVRVVQVQGAVEPALGEGFSCARLSSGQVSCWGSNYRGQLGRGHVEEITEPGPVRGLTDAIKIAAGELHVCALRANHTAVCWGKNTFGQLGDGSTKNRAAPVPVKLTDVVDIGVGSYHSCALRRDRSVWCWGMNSSGQLCDDGEQAAASPVRAKADAVKRIVVGGRTTCLDVGGELRCWGSEIGKSTSAHFSRWISAKAIVALGDGISCRQGDGGQVDCLGAGPAALYGAERIAAGKTHACARLAGGKLVCWGDNRYGQVGDGSLQIDAPVRVEGIPPVAQVAARDDGTCARSAEGKVWCWGFPGHAKLGVPLAVPTQVPVSGVAKVVMGYRLDCAVHELGTVTCWGDNQSRRVLGARRAIELEPTEVASVRDMVDVAVGGFHLCGLSRAGEVFCWGENTVGQVGIGKPSRFEQPSRLAGLRRVTGLVTQGTFTFAVQGGTVWHWGGVYPDREAGIQAQARQVTPAPTQLPRLRDVVELEVASGFGCARLGNGEVSCWKASEFNSPEKLSGLASVAQIAVGRSRGCGVLANGTVSCWSLRGGITAIEGLRDAVEVAVGNDHACARTRGGQVYCWGNGGRGQRGDKVTANRNAPVEVRIPAR